MKKFLSILMVLALVTALFVSCSQDNIGSVVGEDLVSISFATGDSSRTLTVSREAFDEYDYIWCYTAVKADNSGMTQGETIVGGLITEAYVWGDDHTKTGLTGATIEGISQGLWNFTLSAYVPVSAGGEKSAVKAWAGSVTNQPVKKGEANVVNVTVSAVVDPEKDGMITFQNVVVRKLNGSDVTAPAIWTGDKDLILGVKATTLAGAEVDGAFVEYKKGEGHTTSNIPEPKFEVAAGTYFVTFKAYEGTFAEPTFVYAEETIAVNVYSGLRTIISGFVSELSSFVQFGEPVANAVIEASTPSVIEVTPQSEPISFVTDSTQSTSYKAASIPAVSVVNIKETVEAAIPVGSTLTDLALSLNVADKGSTDAAEKTTKNFEISLDAVVTTTDAAGLVSVESKDITGGIEQFMTVQLYIGKELADLKVYHHDVEVKKSGEQELGAEYYEYDKTSAGDGILTLHVNHFSPFSVEYSKKVAVARLIKVDGTGSDFYTLQEAVAAAANGDTVKLLKGIDLSAQIVVTKELTLDLNGQKLYNTNDLWVGDSWSLISVRAGGDLTITGNGTLDPKENDCYAIDVQDGAKLDVKNGTFFGNITVIYAYDGFVTVEGGTFDLYQLSDEETDKYRFMLNCLDKARAAGDAWFTVTGGTFFNFNPADNQSEGPHTNYVPAGYVVNEAEGWYKVSPLTLVEAVDSSCTATGTHTYWTDGTNKYIINGSTISQVTDEDLEIPVHEHALVYKSYTDKGDGTCDVTLECVRCGNAEVTRTGIKLYFLSEPSVSNGTTETTFKVNGGDRKGFFDCLQLGGVIVLPIGDSSATYYLNNNNENINLYEDDATFHDLYVVGCGQTISVIGTSMGTKGVRVWNRSAEMVESGKFTNVYFYDVTLGAWNNPNYPLFITSYNVEVGFTNVKFDGANGKQSLQAWLQQDYRDKAGKYPTKQNNAATYLNFKNCTVGEGYSFMFAFQGMLAEQDYYASIHMYADPSSISTLKLDGAGLSVSTAVQHDGIHNEWFLNGKIRRGVAGSEGIYSVN